MPWSWQKGEWSSNPKNREILIMGCNNLNNGGMTIPNYFEMVPQPVKVLKGRLSHPNLSKQIHFTYKNMSGKSAIIQFHGPFLHRKCGFHRHFGGGIPLLFTSIWKNSQLAGWSWWNLICICQKGIVSPSNLQVLHPQKTLDGRLNITNLKKEHSSDPNLHFLGSRC